MSDEKLGYEVDWRTKAGMTGRTYVEVEPDGLACADAEVAAIRAEEANGLKVWCTRSRQVPLRGEGG